MTALFISDLHLCAERPESISTFYRLLAGPARRAQALYILGDLFEAWIGDDDERPPHAEIVAALAQYSVAGGSLYVMQGNRDFLMGPRFAERTGCTLLPDPSIIELCGARTLLMHGDTLCTQDHDYQAFRRQVRNPLWIQGFLARPLEERAAIARNLREGSRAAVEHKEAEIMDVEPAAVCEVMARHGVRQLIHGHTHRPAIHELSVDGQPTRRIVLGDWYADDSVLVFDEQGPRLLSVAALQ